MNLLIAQIGNRHIKEKESWSETIPKESFREYSCEILKRIENNPQNLKHLELNILPSFLKEVQSYISNNEPITWILFYTDQENTGSRNDQDTVHAAKLVQQLLIHQYHFTDSNIFLEPIKCKPIDVEALLERYLRKTRKIEEKYTEAKVFLCDAGGTAQMKNALREVCELVFYKHLQIIAVPDDFESDASLVLSSERKALWLKKLAVELLEKNQFEGAANIIIALNNHFKTQNALLSKIGYCMLLRQNGHVGPLTKELKSAFPKNAPIWIQDLKKSFEHTHYPLPLKNTVKAFEFVERLLLSEHHLEQNNFEWACFHLHQAIENVLQNLVDEMDLKNYKPKEVTEINPELYLDDLVADLKNHPMACDFLQNHRPNWGQFKKESITTHYFIVAWKGSAAWADLLKNHLPGLMGQINENPKYIGIDVIRNKFAHEGKKASDKAHLQPLIEKFIYDSKTFLHGTEPLNVYSKMRDDTIGYLRRMA